MVRLSKRLAFIISFVLIFALDYGLESLPYSNPFLVSTCGLTTLSNDPATTLINPATGLSGVSSSTSYLYGMDKLSQCEISSLLEYQNSGAFIGWQSLNNDDYTKQDYRLGYRFGLKFLRIGVGYKLSYDKIPGYGSEKDECYYAGIRLLLGNNTIDAATEPIRINSDLAEPEEHTINLSLSRKLSNNTILAFGLTKERDEQTDYKVGCRFPITNHLQALVSWESEPGRFGMGGVFALSWLKLIYAVQTHPELDWTHSVGISIMFP
jgi:hypothetical protein